MVGGDKLLPGKEFFFDPTFHQAVVVNRRNVKNEMLSCKTTHHQSVKHQVEVDKLENTAIDWQFSEKTRVQGQAGVAVRTKIYLEGIFDILSDAHFLNAKKGIDKR